VLALHAADEVRKSAQGWPQGFRRAGGLIIATIDASNYSVVAPALRSALVVASPAMVARPYDLRCELLEFAVFTLVARDQPVLPLHAACVGLRDRAVLLLGESGAGKSTATLRCLLAGLGVLAEDVVFIEPRRLAVTGVPNYLHLRLERRAFCRRQWRGASGARP
jgi:hypothetical protein